MFIKRKLHAILGLAVCFSYVCSAMKLRATENSLESCHEHMTAHVHCSRRIDACWLGVPPQKFAQSYCSCLPCLSLLPSLSARGVCGVLQPEKGEVPKSPFSASSPCVGMLCKPPPFSWQVCV